MNRSRTTVAVLLSVAAAAAILLVLLDPTRERTDVLPDGAPPPEVPPEAPPVPDAGSLREPGAGSPSRSSIDLLPEPPPPVPSGAVPCSGRVLDLETGRPVPRFLLRLTDGGEPGKRRTAELRFQDEAGGFRIEKLGFAPSKVEVQAEGYDSLSAPFQPPVEKPWTLFVERPAFGVRLLLRGVGGDPSSNEGASVRVTLRDDGALQARIKNLLDANEREAVHRLNALADFSAQPGSDGLFQISLRLAGRYLLRGWHPLWAVEELEVPLAPDTGEIALAARAVFAGLRITGNRVPEEVACAWLIDVGESGETGNALFSLKPGGTVRRGPYAPGRRIFLFYPAGSAFRPWCAEADLNAGRYTEIDFDFQPAAPFRGRVLDAVGVPAEGVRVEVSWTVRGSGIRPPGGGKQGRLIAEDPAGNFSISMTFAGGGLRAAVEIKTNEEGIFEFRGLSGVPKSLLVDAGPCGLHRAEVSGETGTLEVRLPFALNRRAVLLRLPDPREFRHVVVRVRGPGIGDSLDKGLTADSALMFSFLADPRSPYSVEVEQYRKSGTPGAPDPPMEVSALELPAGTGPFQAVLEFRPPGEIRVALADEETGDPLAGWISRMRGPLTFDQGPCPAVGAALKAPAGDFEIVVHADGYERRTVPVRVASGEVKDLGTIRLRRTAK
ncbi:MAG: carboxypeptidase-like regulatory domain-containing protein [Planctomycetes bacterium]|nr:carboxypeptidase-like regulatory domain-containing protein [Planctomycetota bacterium]